MVVILDKSLSMRRPASKENLNSRHSLACKGLEWFLNYIGMCFPLEYTGLLTFSSACDVVVPFTRDYELLKSKLGDIAVQDRTDIHAALVAMVEAMLAEWGSFAPCQAVLVTDGSPGVRPQDAVHKRLPPCIPFPCQLYVVCIATTDEPQWTSRQNLLCDLTGITASEIFVPSSPLSATTVRESFKRLAGAHFRPYSGVLKCGHLSSNIGLSPSPSVLRSKMPISVSLENRYPSLDESYPNLQYPKEMVICGFLDVASLPVPPTLTRHFVTDSEVDSKSLDNLVQATGKADDSPVVLPKQDDSESGKPSFRVLLHGSLKCDSKVALVKLSDGWFGLLFSAVSSSSKKSNLVLSVFYPNADIPWLGPFLYLGPKPSVLRKTDGEDSDNPFPVPPSRNLSYQVPGSLLWASESVLQSDMTKIIRYSRKLPEKEGALFKELNKLRLVAVTYTMPELIDVLCGALSKEEASANNPQAKALLSQCIQFLSTNKNPLDKL